MADYTLLKGGLRVRRNIDGLHIPDSADNRDWLDYALWRDSNTPDPIEPDPLPTQDQLNTAAAKADADVIALASLTPAQASAWVTANVNTLADAKQFMKRVAIILSVLAKRL